MKIAVIIPCYNRPEELEECLTSVIEAYRVEDVTYVLIDDASNDPRTTALVRKFNKPGSFSMKFIHKERQGICKNLLKGYQYCFDNGYEVVINLDSDAKVKPNWIIKLLSLMQAFPHNIVTGFHSQTKNRDGSERHPIIFEDKHYCLKKSVGGINFAMTRSLFEMYMLPSLLHSLKFGGNFDHLTSIAAERCGYPMVCAVPSLIQHIARTSTLGHNQEHPDIAEDWKDLSLKNVTLIGVDCFDINRLIAAADVSQKNIEFGAVKLLTSIRDVKDSRIVKSPEIKSKEAYSEFIISHLHEYVDTTHMLVIQHDGYVLNHKAWDDEFLQYDYIGATWGYKDNMNVGNGGFSLRSARLMKILAEDSGIRVKHPEDHIICRIYRRYLEQKYNIRFAPEEVANRFAIEAYGFVFHGSNVYNNQFGFHGRHVDFRNSDAPVIKVAKTPKTRPTPLPVKAFQKKAAPVVSRSVFKKS